MTNAGKLMVPEPVSGGLFLSYKCTSVCSHCMYACSPKWKADWISDADIESYLMQLAGRIRPSRLGPCHVDLNSGLHFTGGEPFLNFDLLLRAAQIARELGIPSTFVETNCYWCSDDDLTEDRMRLLRKAGLHGIMLSVNPFILEYVPFDRTKRAVRIAEEVFGPNAMVYQTFFYSQFRRVDINGTLDFEKYTETAGLQSLHYAELIPMGRLSYRLGHLFTKQRPQSFFTQSCRTILTNPCHIHIDNYGNYFGGFCGGICLGNARNLDAIFAGVDLDKHAVLKALATSIEHLYRLGREFGYEDLPDGYVSPCHVCLDIRRHLVRQTDEFEELRPRQLYLQI